MRKEFADYVERMKKIRLLTTPSLDMVSSEEDYGRMLVDQFRQIGAMAGENRKVVEKILLPLLNSAESLSDEIKAELSELNDQLVDVRLGGELDQHISDMINARLFEEELKREGFDQEDTESYIQSLAKTMQIKYFRMITTQHSNPEESEKCRAEGLEAFDRLKKFLDKETFSKLPGDMRMLAFYNCVNGALLYQAYTGEKRAFYRGKMMEELISSLGRINDVYYREMMPDEDWNAMEIKVYDHMSAILIDPELPEAEAKVIYPYMLRLKELMPKTDKKIISEADVTANLFQAAAMAGEESVTEHFNELLKLYESRDVKDFSRHGVQYNQSYPLNIYECMIGGKVHGENLKEEDYSLLDEIVLNMIDYVGSTPKNLMLTDRIIMHNKLLNAFREHPGSLKYGELCIRSLAAIHPPTYVHSKMVAKISVCLARHLLDKKPEIFLGFPDVDSLEKVAEKKDEILEYTYQAALYHDVGKLTILDTIGMYGRRLLDSEYHNIKCHPVNGYSMAIKFVSMRKYADVIRGHHRYYDNSKGYPEDFDTSKSPYKTIIDIVTIADCMDAATDGVGRSYNIGKTFEDYKKEVREDAGTRYAPYFPEIFECPDVLEDINFLLTKERSRIYKEIYLLLKKNANL